MPYTMRKFLTTSLLVAYCQCVSVQGSLLYEKATMMKHPSDEGNEASILMTWNNGRSEDLKCEMFTDQMLIKEVVKTSGKEQMDRPSAEVMQEMEVELNSLSRRWKRDSTEEEGEEEATDIDEEMVSAAANKWYLIYPGTKWCGAGNIAKNDGDLGIAADTDKCCRAHDMCDDIIPAGETKHGLRNDGRFTALSCKCDNDFYNCLSRVNSVTSNTIGNLYFNILRSRCFKKDYPQTDKCKKYATPLKLTCLEYEKDATQPKVYQWIKAKFYRQLPNPGPLTLTLPF